MKKTILAVALLGAVMSFSSCDKSQSKMDEKPATAQKAPKDLKIAYVENDSISNQYQFAKDFSKILETKGKNIRNTLAGKQQALQQAYANFQQKVRQNAYTQEQAEQVQAGLQKQANDLQELTQRLQGEFEQEQAKYQKAFQDSINNYIARYNKDKKYSFIFIKGGVVNTLLYADKAYDITDEVIAGLNKAYKPGKKGKK